MDVREAYNLSERVVNVGIKTGATVINQNETLTHASIEAAWGIRTEVARTDYLCGCRSEI